MPMYDFLCTACGEKFEELVAGDGASPRAAGWTSA